MKNFRLFLISLILLWAGSAFGVVCGTGPFYVSSSTGVDTNDGLTISTPWAHHPWDANKTDVANCTLAAGNTVYMRRGDVWYDAYLASAQAGSVGNPITTTSIDTFYAVSPADVYPKLSGAYNPSSFSWTRVGGAGNVYCTTAATQPTIAVYNDAELDLDVSRTPSANKWFWVAADGSDGCGANSLYVNVNGGSPAAGILEAGKRGYVNLTSAGNQTFSYLEMRVANGTAGVAFNNGKVNVTYDHITIKHNKWYGIYQYNASGGVVSYCTIRNVFGNTGGAGVGIYASTTNGVAIYWNDVAVTVMGINLVSSDNGNVHHNTVHNTCGALGCFGIQIQNSDLNNVYSNDVHDNATGYYPTGGGAGIYLGGSSQNNNIYWNTVARNYLGIADLVLSGANGNKIFYNLVIASVVNDIDMKQQGTGFEHVYNNTVIHNPSANNTPAYTGHGIDVQVYGSYTKIANNISVNIAPYGVNNQSYAISDVGPGFPIQQIWWDNNLAYSTNGGDLVELKDTGGDGNIYVGDHNNTTWSDFLAAIQGVTVGHKILGMDGLEHGAGAHDVLSNPLFVSDSDFHLQANSPAINAGIFIVGVHDLAGILDLAGRQINGMPAYDLGAYGGIKATAGPAAGDILYFDGHNFVRLPKGTTGQVLRVNTGGTGPEWATFSGAWITPLFFASNFTAGGAMTWTVEAGDISTYAYAIAEKTMTVAFSIGTSSVGGTLGSLLQIAIPAQKVAKKHIYNSIGLIDAGAVSDVGSAEVLAAGTTINCYLKTRGSWGAATKTTHVFGEITFEIN